MGGTYYKLKDDGAPFRCVECGLRKPHNEVIVFEHTETHKRETICLECIDDDWLKEATCLGSL